MKSEQKSIIHSKFVVITFMFIMAFGMSFSSQDVSASKKAASKVTGSLKNGVYTVSGKGKMTDSAKPTASQKKKIKKIVIKKGVTSLPEMAFSNCTKAGIVSIASTVKEIGMQAFAGTSIKRITIPKTVKEIGWGICQNCDLLETMTLPGEFGIQEPSKDNLLAPFVIGKKSLKKVIFSTPLRFPDLVNLVGDCENFELSSDDPKYKSIYGLIYTKDGKNLVRIPYARSEAVIAEGCETVSVGSYSYAADGYCKKNIYNGCGALKSIVFPSSVKKVRDDDYYSSFVRADSYAKEYKCNIKLNTTKLDSKSINILWTSYNLWKESLVKELTGSELAVVNDGMIILKDGYLCGYIEDEKRDEIIIPDSVKVIGKSAFSSISSKSGLKSFVLGKNVEEIEDYAFSNNKGIKVYIKSKKIRISDKAFKDCEPYNIIIE